MSRSGQVIWLVLGFAGLVPAGATAQPAALEPGARIRVRIAGERQVRVGSLVRMAPDSLVLDPGGGSLTVARSRLERVEIYQGRRRPVIRNALIGAVVGAAVGASAGQMARICQPDDPPDCEAGRTTRGEAIGEGALLYGAIGLVGGTVIGMIGHDRWSAPVQTLARITPAAGGPRLVLGGRIPLRR